MIPTVLFFRINFYLLTLVFVLQYPSVHRFILTTMLFQFPSTFLQTQGGIFLFITNLLIIHVVIKTFFLISCSSKRCSMGRYLKSGWVLLLLILNFVIVILNFLNIRSSLIHICGFQLLVLQSNHKNREHFRMYEQAKSCVSRKSCVSVCVCVCVCVRARVCKSVSDLFLKVS